MLKGQATESQKILILAAIPHGLRLDKEIREVEECIRRAVRRDMFEVEIRTAIRPQDIRRAIAQRSHRRHRRRETPSCSFLRTWLGRRLLN
ncbi:hypothetical protein Cylst_6439 (plasmid) [Cylindrospermum stagnale PCC 7417]|uniref:Uncharacterized protein n=1 Tax=Cylindrospermum stagnale PCC 7417 TaxID=56107 RepID=K9X6E0_9NOST|nr:hypothetical protein [Cylindrospermum stagnale]AFZ28230.1 hypothetical protein Cylst_6439 [Cylindrospermum stagnale PCC 7417]